MAVEWVTFSKLSNTQKKVARARYKPPYGGFLYRTWKGQLTHRLIGSDRKKK